MAVHRPATGTVEWSMQSIIAYVILLDTQRSVPDPSCLSARWLHRKRQFNPRLQNPIDKERAKESGPTIPHQQCQYGWGVEISAADLQLQSTHTHLNLNNKKHILLFIHVIHVQLHLDLKIGMDVQRQEKHISSEGARKFGNCSTPKILRMKFLLTRRSVSRKQHSTAWISGLSWSATAGNESRCTASRRSLSILKMKCPQLGNLEENTVFGLATCQNLQKELISGWQIG